MRRMASTQEYQKFKCLKEGPLVFYQIKKLLYIKYLLARDVAKVNLKFVIIVEFG